MFVRQILNFVVSLQPTQNHHVPVFDYRPSHKLSCWAIIVPRPSHAGAVAHSDKRAMMPAGTQQQWMGRYDSSCPREHQPTLTEMWPWAWGRWAAKNQSPGKGLLTLKMPEVLLGSVQLRVSEKTPGTAVSVGKCVCRGLMTGGAPERKYLGDMKGRAVG